MILASAFKLFCSMILHPSQASDVDIMDMTMSSFRTLPQEMKLHIYAYLNFTDLAQTSRVNKEHSVLSKIQCEEIVKRNKKEGIPDLIFPLKEDESMLIGHLKSVAEYVQLIDLKACSKDSLANSLAPFVNLNKISLKGLNETGDMTMIINGMADLKNLTELELMDLSLYMDRMMSLILLLPKIKTLSFKNVEMSSPVFLTLLDNIPTGMENLELNQCGIGDHSYKNIEQWKNISTCSKSEGALKLVTLAANLSKLSTLNSLSLGNNEINDIGLGILASNLKELKDKPQWKHFDLQCNGIAPSKKNLLTLKRVIENLPHLEILDLSCNEVYFVGSCRKYLKQYKPSIKYGYYDL